MERRASNGAVAVGPEHRPAEEPLTRGTGTEEHRPPEEPAVGGTGGTGEEPAIGVRGMPLGFRGLMYAPVNELGVVHLFGVLAPEVGMAVEHIGSAFPDCRAMKAGPDGKWRPVAVEFELRSSNFRVHGHDPSRCDVIVCWENDWEGCPIEVVELKDVLRKALVKG